MKILTVGSTVGSIRDLFSKVKAIDTKHGKFDLLLCVGDFFGPPKEPVEDDEIDNLLQGKLDVPIECYIMQGEYPLPTRVIEKFAKTGGELCNKVFLMSKSGIITAASGVRIACLGGVFDPQIYGSVETAPGFMSPFFSYHSVDKLLANTLVKASSIGGKSRPQQTYSSLASIQASASDSQDIDILLTNAWPHSITEFINTPLPEALDAKVGCPPLDDVIRKTRPRYHFAACGGQPPQYWEREPFIWDQGRISRFVSLGAFGDQSTGKKQRWFYAFSIAPNNTTETQPRPANVTKNPFIGNTARAPKRPLDDAGENYIFGNVNLPQQKRTRVAQPQGEPGKPPPGYKCRRCESTEHFINDCPERATPPDTYICKICSEPGHFVRDCPTRDATGDTGGKKPRPGYVCRACGSENHFLEDCLVANNHPQSERTGRRRGPSKAISTDECWFCLSNPNLAKHLIVAIGSECYVTLPKGQIIPTQSAAGHVDVPGGGHVLVVPITHYPTYSTIPSDLAPPIVDETKEWKRALTKFYAKFGCVPVIFEVGRLTSKGGHAHIQIVPISAKLKDKVEDAFVQEGRLQGITFQEDAEAALASCSNGNGGYFRVDLPNGKKMVHLLIDHVPFGIQFGRQVLVKLLGMPERLDWRACALSEDEDKADVQAFRDAFAPFNPAA